MACAQTLAFPGAEGFGRFATGGRGGDVYIVTNLDDSGPGSLREGVASRTTGVPRTIVFAVSGTIFLNSTLRISEGELTIAGQTAPGDGICLANYPIDPTNSSDVIIRFIRSRLGDAEDVENDAFNCRYATDVIVDHCSFSWSIDETATAYDNTRFTMQWCFVTESLRDSVHDKGEHGYGGIWGGLGASFHHNLLAHHDSRNPRFNGARYHNTAGELVDFRNNVIYNWRGNSTYGGEPTDTGLPSRHNMVNNVYKSGPATGGGSRSYRILDPSSNSNAPSASSYGLFHVAGNWTTASSSVTSDNWDGGVQGPSGAQLAAIRAQTPFDVAPVITQSAAQAYPLVLDFGGCRLPNRDSVDTRIVGEVESGSVTFNGSNNNLAGIIDSQNDVGGWPVLASPAAPTDSDADGMPDSWEIERGLNPDNPDDRNGLNAEGYTNLELYLNELAAPAFPIPVISSQPMSQQLPPGTGFSLSAEVSGPDPLFYQWYLDGDAIEEATDSSYSVPSSSAADAGDYQVMVANDYGVTASEMATIEFAEQPPAVISDPLSLERNEGQAAAFSVNVTGSLPLEYQWFRGDRPLPDQTGDTLELDSVTIADSGPYHVVISNAYGSMASAPATLIVSIPNDDLFSSDFSTDTIHAGSPVISPTSTNWYVMSSKNASTTSVGDDPATSPAIDPRLDLTMGVTSSGVVETAARFSNAPLSLDEVGDEVQLWVVLSTTNVRTLGLGLFNSGGTLPHTGMINGKLTNGSSDFASGGSQAWQGYRMHLDAGASDELVLEKRVTQPGVANDSQSLIVPGTSSSAPSIESIGSEGLADFSWNDGATYTLTLLVKRTTSDSLSLTAIVHADTDISAPALAAATATTAVVSLVDAFDAMAIGFRNRDNASVSHLRVTQVMVGQGGTAVSISNPYEAFLHDYGLDPATDGLPERDLDFDTVANALEFILGGDPKVADPEVLPSFSKDESEYVFRLLRHIDTSSVFDLKVEHSTGLQSWVPLVDGVAGVTIATSPFDATYDEVEVRLPHSGEARRFLRLVASPKP